MENLKDLVDNGIEYDFIIMERDHFSFQKLSNGFRAYVRAKIGKFPFMIEKYNQSKMKKLITTNFSSFNPDIVHIEYNYMHHYVQLNSSTPFILTEHDVTTKVKERLHSVINSNSSLLEFKKWKSIEPAVIKKFDAFITLTKEDKDYTTNWNVPECYVIPPQFSIPKLNVIKNEQISLCFVGSFNRKPNIFALKELLSLFPQIQDHYPQVELKIAGKYLSDELKNEINSINGIQYLGFVDNIDELIAKCTLFVAPIKIGAGLKMKIPHSLSVGTPVITTSVGAEGIPFGENDGLWVEDLKEDFVKKCNDLLQSPRELKRVSNNCIKAVNQYFSPFIITKKLEDVYSSVIERFNGKT
ncbi:MAG: glycosyltransferase family 4 protein [Bacteroidetes bacterium]|nr:glycosyltransferase family 4 protein [Bacteroidota bacterium]